MLGRTFKRMSDWFAITIAGTALRCPRCRGAARNNPNAPAGSFGAKLYVCPECKFGFGKNDVT